jgi:hypothetical protein
MGVSGHFGDLKVDNFNGVVEFVVKDVLGLEVAVRNLLVMKVVNGFKYQFDNRLALGFI